MSPKFSLRSRIVSLVLIILFITPSSALVKSEKESKGLSLRMKQTFWARRPSRNDVMRGTWRLAIDSRGHTHFIADGVAEIICIDDWCYTRSLEAEERDKEWVMMRKKTLDAALDTEAKLKQFEKDKKELADKGLKALLGRYKIIILNGRKMRFYRKSTVVKQDSESALVQTKTWVTTRDDLPRRVEVSVFDLATKELMAYSITVFYAYNSKINIEPPQMNL